MPEDRPIAQEQWITVLDVLRRVARDTDLASEQQEFKSLVSKINRTARRDIRREARQLLPEHFGDAAFPRPALAPHGCYVCKSPYTAHGGDYPQLCDHCAALNRTKKLQMADLTGRYALVTGGRIKIGHATALKLLRCGANVTVTTRFPHDALSRFAGESDYVAWRERLGIYGLDFRHLAGVQTFVQYLHSSLPALDILINNAAQTVARPPAFYAHLLEAEGRVSADPERVLAGAPLLTDLASALTLPGAPPERPEREFPAGRFDRHGQQLDLRPGNSWSANLADINVRELLEVQLINTTAPFVLCSQLRPLMERSGFARRFIVNVAASEGQFARSKAGRHPHTNMAKAALNMLTHTSAADYARSGIYMNSIDTGWVSNEQPFDRAAEMAEAGFEPPLTLEDAAARLCDPVVCGVIEGRTPQFGLLLKDYRPQPW